MTKVAVVILNYNGKHFLQQFLPTVVRYSEGALIVVADNGSTDGSADWVYENFATVRLIRLKENKGFCGGYNEVLRQVEATYYVLLNSDVEVTEGWLHPVIDLFDKDEKVGAAQPKLLSFKEKNRFEYAGAAGGHIDVMGYPFCRGRLFDSMEEDQGQYDDTREVFWASGACCFVRAECYHRMGGLDEDFFAHMEEIDLCWKLKRAGYKIMYCGSSRVYHVGGGTLSALNPRKTYFNFRNGLSLVFKHQSATALVWKLPFRLALDWAAALHFLVSGSAGHARAVIIAHLSFIRRIGHEWKKRSKLLQLCPTFRVAPVYKGMVIVRYFLRGKKVSPEVSS